MAWEATADAWQYDLLDQLPCGVDVSQIEESLRHTPTERLERMRAFAAFLDDVRSSGERRPASAD